MVVERETGLEEIAETGVMVHADLSSDLLEAIFTPSGALHDGAVIIRGTTIVAAGAVLPLAETTVQAERFGTRHRAALGITEQTDAVVVVVSEETGAVSLVERGRIVRNQDQQRLTTALTDLLEHDELANARLPERATRLRSTIPAAARRGRSRIARSSDKPTIAGPSSATPAAPVAAQAPPP